MKSLKLNNNYETKIEEIPNTISIHLWTHNGILISYSNNFMNWAGNMLHFHIRKEQINWSIYNPFEVKNSGKKTWQIDFVDRNI